MKTIALYGGSFDPPHLGHEAVVNAVLKLNEIDELIIMPTFLNPLKKRFFAAANLRLHWLEDIYASYKNVTISSYEVQQKKRVTTLQTVEYLLKSFDKIYLVIGADNLQTLHKWHKIECLQEKVTFIVATRNDIDIPKNFKKVYVDISISSSNLRKNIDINKLSTKSAEFIEQHYKDNNER